MSKKNDNEEVKPPALFGGDVDSGSGEGQESEEPRMTIIERLEAEVGMSAEEWVASLQVKGEETEREGKVVKVELDSEQLEQVVADVVKAIEASAGKGGKKGLKALEGRFEKLAKWAHRQGYRP